MIPSFTSSISTTDLNDVRVLRAAINATFATLQRRLLSVDPWLPLATTVQTGSYYPPSWQASASSAISSVFSPVNIIHNLTVCLGSLH